MSLTIVFRTHDGLVMAADSRVTEGYTLDGPKIQDDSVKFIQLAKHVGILTYGLSDIGNTAIIKLKEKIDKTGEKDISFSNIFRLGKETFNKINIEWGSDNPKIIRKKRDVSFVIAGYDKKVKEYAVYNLQSPEFTPIPVKSGCLLGGQWHIAKFFIKNIYSHEMGVDYLKRFSALLLASTMTVEKTVGGKIRLASIKNTVGFRWIEEEELTSMKKDNDNLISMLKKEFQGKLASLAMDKAC